MRHNTKSKPNRDFEMGPGQTHKTKQKEIKIKQKLNNLTQLSI